VCKAEYSPCSTCLLIAKCSCLYPAAAYKLSAFSHPNHSSSYICMRCVFADVILKLCTTMQIENCSGVTERISPLTMSARGRDLSQLTHHVPMCAAPRIANLLSAAFSTDTWHANPLTACSGKIDVRLIRHKCVNNVFRCHSISV